MRNKGNRRVLQPDTKKPRLEESQGFESDLWGELEAVHSDHHVETRGFFLTTFFVSGFLIETAVTHITQSSFAVEFLFQTTQSFIYCFTFFKSDFWHNVIFTPLSLYFKEGNIGNSIASGQSWA